MMADQLEREITPPEVYFNRRAILRGGVMAATAAGTALLYRKLNGVELDTTEGTRIAGLVKPEHSQSTWVEGETITPRASILNYNNFYEFTTNKDGVAAAAKNFKTDGWKIEVGGLCNKPRVFDLDAFKKLAPIEERVYRHRCGEAWAMVVSWAGLSVANLLKAVDPQGSAKFVAFETLYDPARMPNQKTGVLKWPYVEGLRLDEAMHPLALFANGLYGQELLLLVDAYRHQRGGNEVNFAIKTTGLVGLTLLVLALLGTPLRRLTGWAMLISVRRNLGVIGILYILTHFLSFFWWDRNGSISSTVSEIIDREYLWYGFGALVIMTPLAITSTDAMVSRLGAKRWKLLHRLTYLAVAAGGDHYYLQAKSDKRPPDAYLIAIGL